MAVTKLLIRSRQPFAQAKTFGQVGPYEQLDGTVYVAVDPDHPANRLITDLPLAPRDASGLVHVSADCRLLRPVAPQRGNRRLLFDILTLQRHLFENYAFELVMALFSPRFSPFPIGKLGLVMA